MKYYLIFLGSLFFMCLFGSMAYYQHIWQFWIVSAAALGVFVWSIVPTWKAAKAQQ